MDETTIQALPAHRTRIVATIGPASQDVSVLERMIQAGMDVARLNFSHGTPENHATLIQSIRQASRNVGRPIAILADLPGPKIRIGEVEPSPLTLQAGQEFFLTTRSIRGDAAGVSVSLETLPQLVRPGDPVFLNDGEVELRVERIEGDTVYCRVQVGGEIASRKGLNLPGADLDLQVFTPEDRQWLAFAAEHRVELVSMSFVGRAEDLHEVRAAAEQLGYVPFLIAKIERRMAVERLDEILEAADGVMVARGDLGVEVPLEEVPLIQKRIVQHALARSRPVITATQMLESMRTNRRPTRAEVTDVANAIWDGTDAVMLSAESAAGRFPVESIQTMARIAAAAEKRRPETRAFLLGPRVEPRKDVSLSDLIAWSVDAALERTECAAVIVPTASGATARALSRFRLPVWIVAVTRDPLTAAALRLSYGVIPVRVDQWPESWDSWARDWIRRHGLSGDLALLVQGPSPRHPTRNHSLEYLRLR